MSNLPAIPTTQEFATMRTLAKMAVDSGYLPASIKTPEQAVIIMLKGRELGLPPMQAFSGINVIQGKPAVSPETQLALIFQNVPGATVDFVKTDNESCVIEAKRPGGKVNTFSFTLEDAKRANLLDKGNWRTFPAAMLRARCISAMARALFPDAIAGASYTPDELGAETDEDGNVVEIPGVESREVTPPEPNSKASSIALSTNSTEKKSEPVDDRDPWETVITFGETYKDKTIRQAIEHKGQGNFEKWIEWLESSAKAKGFSGPPHHIACLIRDYRQGLDAQRLEAMNGQPNGAWQAESFFE